MQQDILDKMEEIRSKYNISPGWIEIEITESFHEMERNDLAEICQQITMKGYRLALDDFGSKYSNLSALSALPLNVLKIDRAVVCDIYTNERTRVIVKNLMDACHTLGIRVVAEGVETENQLKILASLNCDCCQGFFLNKAISLSDFEEKYLSVTAVL